MPGYSRIPAIGTPAGGGLNKVFYENDKLITDSYTINIGKNASSTGPVELASGVVVEVPIGSTWTVI